MRDYFVDSVMLPTVAAAFFTVLISVLVGEAAGHRSGSNTFLLSLLWGGAVTACVVMVQVARRTIELLEER